MWVHRVFTIEQLSLSTWFSAFDADFSTHLILPVDDNLKLFDGKPLSLSSLNFPGSTKEAESLHFLTKVVDTFKFLMALPCKHCKDKRTPPMSIHSLIKVFFLPHN